MRDLSLQPGIGADANFVNGNLVDEQTLVGEGINQDMVQFFQKLADLAGTVFNNLPDNETNGYQLITAFQSVVESYAIALNGGAKTAIVDIGTWNMENATGLQTISVNHGLTLSKIRRVAVFIQDDTGVLSAPLDSCDVSALPVLEGGVTSVGVTKVFMNRRTGGLFDTVNFSSLVINRGWMVISHLP